MKELRALTGVRALAALWVFGFHSSLGDLPHMPRFLSGIVEAGYAAVSLFFVLSGFILAYNYLPRQGRLLERQTLGSYFVARFARIYPTYLLALVLAAFAQGPLLFPGHTLPPFRANLLTLFGLQTWTFGRVVSLDFPVWSVSCELFFYALFPVILVAVRRVPPRRAWPSFLAAAALTTAVAFVGAVVVRRSPELQSPFQFFPPSRLLEFVSGVMLGYAFSVDAVPRAVFRRPDLTVGLALLAAIVMILRLSSLHVFLHSGGLALPYALVILGLGESKGVFFRALSTKAAMALGEASYSIYILQFPLKDLMTDLWWNMRGDAPKPVWFRATTFFLVLAVGLLVNRGFENPVRRWIVARYRRRIASPA